MHLSAHTDRFNGFFFRMHIAAICRFVNTAIQCQLKILIESKKQKIKEEATNKFNWEIMKNTQFVKSNILI